MLPNIFWSRTDYISGAYATKMVAISSPDLWFMYMQNQNEKVYGFYSFEQFCRTSDGRI